MHIEPRALTDARHLVAHPEEADAAGLTARRLAWLILAQARGNTLRQLAPAPAPTPGDAA